MDNLSLYFGLLNIILLSSQQVNPKTNIIRGSLLLSIKHIIKYWRNYNCQISIYLCLTNIILFINYGIILNQAKSLLAYYWKPRVESLEIVVVFTVCPWAFVLVASLASPLICLVRLLGWSQTKTVYKVCPIL